jgi:hypothetical protein
MAYRFGITAPRIPYQFPEARRGRVAPGRPDRPQPLHPVRPLRQASRDLDGKNVFQFVGRGTTSASGSTREAAGETRT